MLQVRAKRKLGRGHYPQALKTSLLSQSDLPLLLGHLDFLSLGFSSSVSQRLGAMSGPEKVPNRGTTGFVSFS